MLKKMSPLNHGHLTNFVVVLVVVLATLTQCSNAQVTPGNPCQRPDAVTVPLPRSGECLVYEREEKHWKEAQTICERDGGTLLRLNEEAGAKRLGLHEQVRDCLYANLSGSGVQVDFWVGAVSEWTPQWKWVNGTTLTRQEGCTVLTPELLIPGICSRYLSVDYCVAHCQKEKPESNYVVLRHLTTNPCCYCAVNVDTSRLHQCAPYTRFTGQGENNWIYPVVSPTGIRLKLDSSEVLTRTETLCAAISRQSATEFDTQPCFTRNRYVCELGTRNGCNLEVAGRCLYIGEELRTWMEARDDCVERAGDLVVPTDPPLLSQLLSTLPDGRSFWVGATNHQWNFIPDSAVFGEAADKESNSCGHMFYQKDLWDWDDSGCDVRKPFLCRFSDSRVSGVSRSLVDPNAPEVQCMWNVTIITCGASDDACPRIAITPATVIVEPTFPLAAVIAASIVGLLTLLTILMLLWYSRRRGWLRKKDLGRHPSNASSRTHRHIIKRWSSSYGQYPDHMSDLDTMSTAHTNVVGDMSFISLPNMAFYNPALAPDSPGWPYAYTSLPRALSEPGGRTVKESFTETKTETKEINGAPPYETVNVQGTELPLGLTTAQQTIHSRSEAEEKEYEELMARMDFRDEFDSRPSSMRLKPEVALSTSDVDMNFTVNRLNAKKTPRSPPSRIGSHDSHETHERTMEEIELPMGTTVEVPVYAHASEAAQILY